MTQPTAERSLTPTVFEVWAGFVLPDLAGCLDGLAVGKPYATEFEAVFHDAADLRLARAGIELRHERSLDAEGPDGADEGRAEQVWEVVVPAVGVSDVGRLAANGSPDAVPAAITNVVVGVLRGAPTEPVATVRIRRTVVVLVLDGVEVAQVRDDEISVLDHDRVATRFRQVGIDGTEAAPPQLATAIAACVQAAGGGVPTTASTLARALGPRAAVPADPMVPFAEPDGPAEAAVRAVLASTVRQVLSLLPHLVLEPSVEVVHQARVAVRRLRSDLRTLRPVLDPAVLADLATELGWFAGVLGGARDLDVLALRLRAGIDRLDPVDTAGGDALLPALEPLCAAARAEVVDAAASDRTVALGRRLVVLATAPPVTFGADEVAVEVMRSLAREPWRRLARDARRVGRHSPIEELHALRIRVKRARYAAEAVSRVVPGAARHAKALVDVQDLLGDLHDGAMAEAWLRDRVAARLDPAAAFSAGLLVAAEHARAERRRRQWRATWARADRRRLRSWVEGD
ncbi:MAG: CHAD domain-containing protein [Acidimicrobiales bacterium]